MSTITTRGWEDSIVERAIMVPNDLLLSRFSFLSIGQRDHLAYLKAVSTARWLQETADLELHVQSTIV
jgi:hypothetical protein